MTKAKAAKKAQSKNRIKPKLNAGDRRALLDDKIEELEGAQRVYGQSVLEWEEAHAHAGELKKTMEKNQARLNSVAADIVAIRSGNYTPPLPFPAHEEKHETNGQATTGDEYWRLTPLAELGITGPLAEKLEAEKLTTLGAIADYTAKNRLTDIKGIGEKAAETIENACTEFWKKHPKSE